MILKLIEGLTLCFLKHKKNHLKVAMNFFFSNVLFQYKDSRWAVDICETEGVIMKIKDYYTQQHCCCGFTEIFRDLVWLDRLGIWGDDSIWQCCLSNWMVLLKWHGPYCCSSWQVAVSRLWRQQQIRICRIWNENLAY